MPLPDDAAAESTVIVSNPMRYLVPLGTALFVLVMFVMPVALAGVSGGKVVTGTVVLAICILWLVRSAWIAPFELTIAQAGLEVRRWSGARSYGADRVQKWWFAIPDGAPTESAPTTNGVLYIVFDDQTRFRGEVTSEEATRVAGMLPKR